MTEHRHPFADGPTRGPSDDAVRRAGGPRRRWRGLTCARRSRPGTAPRRTRTPRCSPRDRPVSRRSHPCQRRAGPRGAPAASRPAADGVPLPSAPGGRRGRSRRSTLAPPGARRPRPGRSRPSPRHRRRRGSRWTSSRAPRRPPRGRPGAAGRRVGAPLTDLPSPTAASARSARRAVDRPAARRGGRPGLRPRRPDRAGEPGSAAPHRPDRGRAARLFGLASPARRRSRRRRPAGARRRRPRAGARCSAGTCPAATCGRRPRRAGDSAPRPTGAERRWIAELERMARVGTWTYELATGDAAPQRHPARSSTSTVGIEPDGSRVGPVEGEQVALLCRGCASAQRPRDHQVELALPGVRLSCRAEVECGPDGGTRPPDRRRARRHQPARPRGRVPGTPPAASPTSPP